MKTVFPPAPFLTYNEWIRYIHDHVNQTKSISKR